MIGHAQPEVQYRKHRTHKSLYTTIAQMKDFLDRQHDLNRLVTVFKLAAALFFSSIQPDLFKIVRQPEDD